MWSGFKNREEIVTSVGKLTFSTVGDTYRRADSVGCAVILWLMNCNVFFELAYLELMSDNG